MVAVNYPLNEQVALITGGASGIGRAMADGLLSAGARVVIASRRSDLVHRTAAELSGAHPHARAYPYVFDLRDRRQTEVLMKWMYDTFGRVDVLINNSGVADHADITELEDDAWDYVMETNLRGAMWLIRATLPGMIARDFGDIVNVVSQAGRHGYHDVPTYCASKHGLIGLARAVDDQMRRERRNIRIFNLCPSLVDVSQLHPSDTPRDGTMHVRNMVRTMMFCLSLDRNVRLGEIDILAI